MLRSVVDDLAVPRRRTSSADADSPRAAFDALLAFFQGARGPGDRPVTFLLDEVLEFRTFENFPGLRHVLHDLVEGLTHSTNRFVLTTRYVTRALRFFRDQADAVELIALTPLSADEVRSVVPASSGRAIRTSLRAIHALSDGHAGYAQAIGQAMASLGGADPISALASLLAPEASLTREMTYSYELRLHRARGYGALKGILDILAARGAADAHRDRAAPAAHARIDQGLPVVARRRRPGLGAPEALQLRRPAAPPVGAPALPPRTARGGRGRPPGAALRAVAAAAGRTRAGRGGTASGIIEID